MNHRKLFWKVIGRQQRTVIVSFGNENEGPSDNWMRTARGSWTGGKSEEYMSEEQIFDQLVVEQILVQSKVLPSVQTPMNQGINSKEEERKRILQWQVCNV